MKGLRLFASFGWVGAILALNIDRSYAQVVSFAKTFGGSSIDWANSVQQTTDGGYIVAGRTASFGAGGWDLLLLKLDGSGDVQWVKTFGGNNDDGALYVQQTTDGGYIVAGYTRSFGTGYDDILLLKLDGSGNVQWVKTFGGSSDDWPHSVQQTADGGYIVAGWTWSFGAVYSDLLLLKLDGSGNVQWTKIFRGSDYEWANSVQQTTDGGYIVAGYTWSFGAGMADLFLIKLDGSGDVQWVKTFGGSDWEWANSVQQTTDSGYIVAGGTRSFGEGEYDLFLLKLDVSGNVQWAKTFGGSGSDWARYVQQTTDGGYIVAGYTSSFGAGYVDLFLLKLDGSGNLQWAKTFGGSGYDSAYSVQQTIDGGYIVVGITESFGAGWYDFFILKTNASGNIGSCDIVQSSSPTLNTPSPTVTSPTPSVTSPTLTVTSPTLTVTSPSLTVNSPCPLSNSEDLSTLEDQRFDGCYVDVLDVGRGQISVKMAGEFVVKIYDVRGSLVKEVKGKDGISVKLERGVYFVEITKDGRRISRKVVLSNPL